MHYAPIPMLTFISGILLSVAPSHAVSRSILEATAGNGVGGIILKVEYQRHYYRRHGANEWHRYYRDNPPPEPVRPLSCGEFRFWDGERCVDVRFR